MHSGGATMSEGDVAEESVLVSGKGLQEIFISPS
jgi:hypothetical protein